MDQVLKHQSQERPAQSSWGLSHCANSNLPGGADEDVPVARLLRRRVRFYVYDEFGKIKRIFSLPDGSRQEYCQEAFEDTPEAASPHWSLPLVYEGLDTSSLPHVDLPAFEYDASGAFA